MGTKVIEVKQLKFEVVGGSEVILCPPRPTGTLVYSSIALLFIEGECPYAIWLHQYCLMAAVGVLLAREMTAIGSK